MRTRTLLVSAVVGLLAVGASTTARADYKSTVLADNPPGYWRLDALPPVVLSYATNITVQGDLLNGVIGNYVREGLPGAIAGDTDKAMQFIGNGNSVVVVPFDNVLNQGASFTFECWMKPACAQGNALALVVNRNGESGYTVYINGDGTFGFNMSRGAGGGFWSSCLVTNPPMVMTNLVDKWTHVACVYDQLAGTSGYGVEYVYFNGLLMATNELPTTGGPFVPNTGGPFRIGDRNYSGLLDEVAAYPVALTPAQLLAHYQAGTNGLGQYRTTILADNPDGYWRLNETGGFTPAPVIAANSGTLGAIENGTYDLGIRLQQPGAIVASTDKSIFCDGLKAVWAPAGVAANPAAPFSVEFWTKPSQAYAGAGTAQACPLSGADRDFGRSGWLFYQGGNGFSWWLGNTVGYTIQMDPTMTVSTTNWYHIVGTYNGTNAVLYVNGVQVATGAGAFTPNQDKPISIGMRYDNSFGYQGLIDEVATYNTVLSPTDVMDHYQNGTNATPSQTYDSLVSAKNPLTYWRLNESSSITYPGVANSGWLGSTVDGSVVGTMALNTDSPLVGDPNPSVDFTAGGRIAIPFDPALNRTNAFSYEVWYNQTLGTGTPHRCPLWWRDEPVLGDTRGWVHYIVNNGNTFQSSDVYTTWNGLDAAALFEQGAWQHLVCTFDGKVKKMYINGVLVAVSTTATLAVKPVTRAVTTISSASYPWLGSLDEPAIYTNALTVERVQAHYVAARGVNPPAVAPTFGLNAVGATNFEGAVVTVRTIALGTAPFTYQWYKGTTAVPGQNTDTLTLSPAREIDSGDYTLKVTNSGGSMDSAIATVLVIKAPPSIITDLVPAVRVQGASVTFTVVAGGSEPLTYQWKSNNVTIAGAPNTNSLTLNNIQPSFAANYGVFVSNAAGNTNSSTVGLTVIPVAAGSYAASVVADQPVAYWRLDDTDTTTLIARDYAGGHDGLYDASLSVTFGQPSAILGDTDYSATFNMSGGVTVPYNTDLNPYTTFSLEAWAKPDPNGAANDRPILFSSTSASGWAYGYILSANAADNWAFTTGQKTSGFDTIATTNSAATNAGWTHLVCTMNDATSEKRLYVNGQLVAQDAPATGTFAPNQETAVGTPPVDQGIGFNPTSFASFWGGLDEVAFYNYPLTSAQVTQHYAAGAMPSLTVSPPVNGKLVITWSGILLQAANITGPWTTNTTAVSPWTNTPSGAREFYRSLIP